METEEELGVPVEDNRDVFLVLPEFVNVFPTSGDIHIQDNQEKWLPDTDEEQNAVEEENDFNKNTSAPTRKKMVILLYANLSNGI